MLNKYLPRLSTRTLAVAAISLFLIFLAHLPAASVFVLAVATGADLCGAAFFTFLAAAFKGLELMGPDGFDERMRRIEEKYGQDVARGTCTALNHVFALARAAYAHAFFYPVFNGIAFLTHFALSAGAHVLAKLRAGASR